MNVGRIYVADTNNIYIEAGILSCLFYDGISANFVDFQDSKFKLERVNGYDKNNIFFGGFQIYSNEIHFPAMKKFTNGVFSTYILDSVITSIRDIAVISGNDAWLIDHEKAYHFNNGIISTYIIRDNDSTYLGRLYFDNYNVYAYAINYSKKEFYTYKFNGNNFQLIRIDCYSVSDPNCVWQSISICGSDIISFYAIHNKLKYFQNDIWHNHSSFDSVSITPSQIAGWNKDSMVALCTSYNYGGFQLYFYNGKNWKSENIEPLWTYGSIDNFCDQGAVKSGNVYMLYISKTTWATYLLIGRPKK
ncbi:MAG: hypothetical protein JW917_06855 [Ignavibacteria bacterium]|nr:hypothetical protein [Ignavibacteria bacterium]